MTALTKGRVDGEEEEEEGEGVTDSLPVNSKSLFPASLWRGRQEERWNGGGRQRLFPFEIYFIRGTEIS